MRERTDEELMLASGQGDRGAFSVLVERHYEGVVRFVHRFLGSVRREATEDLAQDVFLKVWKASPGFEPRATVKTWLLRTATRTCLDYRRRGRLRRTLSLWSESTPEPPARDPEPSEDTETRESAEPVRHAIARLPAKQRAAIVLRHYHELSYTEIAEVLQLSGPAVESLLFRARRTLRTELAPIKGKESPQVSPGLGA